MSVPGATGIFLRVVMCDELRAVGVDPAGMTDERLARAFCEHVLWTKCPQDAPTSKEHSG